MSTRRDETYLRVYQCTIRYRCGGLTAKLQLLRCNHGNRISVTLVTWVVVAEVTLSAVMVSGDTTHSLPWVPAFTCSTFISRESYTLEGTHCRHTHQHTHAHNTACSAVSVRGPLTPAVNITNLTRVCKHSSWMCVNVKQVENVYMVSVHLTPWTTSSFYTLSTVLMVKVLTD